MTTFVALGDSITLGVGDPVRSAEGRLAWRGWAAILADSLEPAPGGWHNLAANGACMADVEGHQLPRALALRPDLASVVVGVNDTLRSGFRADRIADSLAHTIGALRSAGAEVMTVRLPDPGWMFGLPGVLARPLARRMGQVNAAVDETSARFGAIVFDAAADPAIYDRRMWAVDRLHPSERGHRMLACRFHELLGAAGYPVGPAPDPEPSSPPPGRLAEFGWLATKGSAWVLRRSTDLLPALLALAAREALTGSKAPAPLALPGPSASQASLTPQASQAPPAPPAPPAREGAELTWPTG